ncbi:MAG: AMP-binding protein [Polyangiaceae bacterium]
MNLPTATSPSSSGAQTLAQLFMRIESGPGAAARVVAKIPTQRGWDDVPGWRFFRGVLRMGLWMGERGGLVPGERVVVIAPLRLERLVVEWATVAQGGVVAVLDPTARDEALDAALRRLSPRIVFAASPGDAGRVRGRVSALGDSPHVVAVEGEVAGTGLSTWASVMDLAGTLDTAERAQAFRAASRAVRAEMPAVAHPVAGSAGAASWTVATQGEVLGRLVELWNRYPPRRGDVAYAIDAGAPGRLRLALWAFLADGMTTLALGTPTKLEDELLSLRPSVVAVPPHALARMRGGPWREPVEPADPARTAFAWLARRLGRSMHEPPPARRIFTLEGEPRSLG